MPEWGRGSLADRKACSEACCVVAGNLIRSLCRVSPCFDHIWWGWYLCLRAAVTAVPQPVTGAKKPQSAGFATAPIFCVMHIRQPKT